ncbi:5093_t:CDS:10 [Entrophospora sp. SA101]|nr:5093_t:CDS:10 [Entrophospora sp. SA101]
MKVRKEGSIKHLGITLTASPTIQHTDLLHYIAKKERKVLELREELKRNEEELNGNGKEKENVNGVGIGENDDDDQSDDVEVIKLMNGLSKGIVGVVNGIKNVAESEVTHEKLLKIRTVVADVANYEPVKQTKKMTFDFTSQAFDNITKGFSSIAQSETIRNARRKTLETVYQLNENSKQSDEIISTTTTTKSEENNDADMIKSRKKKMYLETGDIILVINYTYRQDDSKNTIIVNEFNLISHTNSPFSDEQNLPLTQQPRPPQPSQQQSRIFNQPLPQMSQSSQMMQQPPINQHDFSRPVPSSAILEIKQINPFNTHFTIKAFVVYKSEIKQWSNNRGQGRLFNVTLMDKSGEIRATAFTFCVDKFYELLKENKAYYMTKLKVVLNKNPIYQGHKYELHFENSSEVRLLRKREIDIVDKSGYEVTATIWGNLIDSLECTIGSVIIIKSARVSDFRGKSLSTTNSTVLITDPSLPEATELSEWYSTGGSQLEFNSLAGQTGGSINIKEAQKSLEEIKSDKTLGYKEKPDYFTVRATVAYIHNKGKELIYPSCSTCKKKVFGSDNNWSCDRCSKSFETPTYRYILPIRITDHSDSAWMNCFDETAALILGMPADDFRKLRDVDPYGYENHIKNRLWESYIFKEKTIVNNNLVAISEIDYVAETSHLCEKINELEKL